MSRRRRIWCELLPPEELADPATLSVLRRYHLEPLIALPPARETDAMAHALRALAARDIRIGLWPLLGDEHGYWPSQANSDHFVRRVQDVLAFAAEAGVHVETLAIDLEPPLAVTRMLTHGGLVDRGTHFARNVQKLIDPQDREAMRSSTETFAALEHMLALRGIETLAAVLPMVVLDLASDAPFWQSLLRTPVDGPEWRVISPMLYTSLIASMLPSKRIEDARALLYTCASLLVESVGAARASVSVGLVGRGKLGDEPILTDPEELAKDVAAAIAAGVDDLALFSLETALDRGADAWLTAFTETRAERPSGLRSDAVSGLVRAFTWAVRPLSLLWR